MSADATNGSSSNKDERAKVAAMMEGIDFAMLTTVDESGDLHSRPMSTQEAEFDGDVWFFLSADSDLAADVRRNPRVNVGYSQPNKMTYLSVAGHAALVTDKAKMTELWNPALQAWFPQGVETPGIALLRVAATTARYWDSPSSPVAHLIGLVKAKATGESQQVGDAVTVRMGG